MSRSSVILRNVASNWIGFAANAAVTFVLTPFVLRNLGAARYGIWILTSSVVGYYGLLDVGFRAGVTQYVTRYLAIGDYRRASEAMSTAVALLSGFGVLILGLSLAAASLAPAMFKVPPALAREAFWCILIVGGSSAIQFGLQPYASVLTAKQRFDLANAIGVLTRIVTAVGIVIALRNGTGLIGVAVATCTANASDYAIRWYAARRLAPGIVVTLGDVNFARAREIGVFGLWTYLISVNSFVFQQIPNLLIAAVMPVAAVGQYALAMGLIRQINSILLAVPQALCPAATDFHFTGDRPRLERLYHDGSRLLLLVLVSVVLIGMFWAEDFYRLWIGEAYLRGTPFHSVALLFQILLLSSLTSDSSGIGNSLLVGTAHIRELALTLICGSIINVSLSAILIRHYGLAGVATAAVIASFLIDVLTIPLLVQRVLGLPVRRFIFGAWRRPMGVALIEIALFDGLRLLGRAESWPDLIGRGILAGTGAMVIILAVGIRPDERRRLLVEPFRRLWRTPSASATYRV